MFKSDNGGLALTLKDVKLSTTASASSWGTRLSQIGRSNYAVTIVTYSLPSMDYIENILGKRERGITIIAHERFKNRALQIKSQHREIQVLLTPDVHAKIVLIEPETVWLSSANFGESHWFEHTLGIHDKRVYEFYHNEILQYLRKTKPLYV